MQISLIVAMTRNRVIGRDNTMPWYLPADLRRFKSLTLGKPIVMGRNTHEAIGRALPGRQNIVVTRRKDYQAAGCEIANSLCEVITLAGEAPEIMVIGGEYLYKQMLPYAERLYLTLIDTELAGDICFPDMDLAAWRESERSLRAADERNPYDLEFLIYDKC